VARRAGPPAERPPLAEADLRALALSYVARYATSSGKLISYLTRKLRERGWASDSPPPLDALIADFIDCGYLDDSAFAAMRAAGLKRRGFGEQRVKAALRHAGVPEDLARDVSRIDPDQALFQAVQFARRKRIGPFSQQLADQKIMTRWFGQLVRAGHPPDIAKKLLRMDINLAMSIAEPSQGFGKQD
jgi:regulatory protein